MLRASASADTYNNGKRKLGLGVLMAYFRTSSPSAVCSAGRAPHRYDLTAEALLSIYCIIHPTPLPAPSRGPQSTIAFITYFLRAVFRPGGSLLCFFFFFFILFQILPPVPRCPRYPSHVCQLTICRVIWWSRGVHNDDDGASFGFA